MNEKKIYNIPKINIYCLSDLVNINKRYTIYNSKVMKYDWAVYFKSDFTFTNYYFKAYLKKNNCETLTPASLRDKLLKRMLALDERMFNTSCEYAGNYHYCY
jgi:hypothetical protein